VATHDYVIANGTGAAVRSDLNGALAAIVSNNSSATEPATMYAYQWWPDTTTGLLKQRNSANSAWVTIGTLASTNLGLLPVAGGTMTGALAVTAGTAALPGIAVSGDLNTGLVSPGADQLAITTGGTSRLAVSTTAVSSTLAVDVPLGAVGTPSITFTGDLNTGLFSPGADTLALVTGGTNRVHVTSGGLVGIGTTGPVRKLHIAVAGSDPQLRLQDTSATESINTGIEFNGDSSRQAFIGKAGSSDLLIVNDNASGSLRLYTNGQEKARIDSSGRLLVGTSSAPSAGDGQYGKVIIQGYTGDNTAQAYLSLQRGEVATSVSSGEEIAAIGFNSSDGYSFANIKCFADAAAGASDYPGRLVFSTTADGAATPTERMRISKSGTTSFSNAVFVHPETDNAVSLGLSGYRWSQVWAANGSIQTSDQRTKTEITGASLGADFIKALRPVSYKWIEGGKVDSGERDSDGNYIYKSVPGTRTHWGFIAQEVKQTVDDAGVDFGGWVLTNKDDPDSQQALRYDQFIAPLTKALQEALAKIEALETRLSALEGA
jgi:hypothetical protein